MSQLQREIYSRIGEMEQNLRKQARILKELEHVLKEKEKKKQRRFQVHPYFLVREEKGYFNTSFRHLLLHEDMFRRFFRMKLSTFHYILEGIRPLIVRISERAISPEERLIITLKYIANGDSFMSMSDYFMMGDNTIGKIVMDTLKAIRSVYESVHMPHPTRQTLEESARGFYEKQLFPNCIAALDGKHFRVHKPANTERFYNRKGFHSINIQALVDSNCKFISVESGSFGSTHDSRVFHNSDLFSLLNEENSPLPPPRALPGTSVLAPQVIIADKGYPLKYYLLKPYTADELTTSQRHFNEKLNAARKIVEQTFGQLTLQFRVFENAIRLTEDNADHLIMACAVLHNLLIDKEQRIFSLVNHSVHVRQTRKTFPIVNAFEFQNEREKFEHYFHSFKLYKKYDI